MDSVEFTMTGSISDAPLSALLAASESALFEEAEAVMATSKAEWVPVDEGILRASGHVVAPVREGSTLIVVLAYGGDAEAYAIVQHENPHYHHQVGSWKYLELPVLYATPGFGDRIAARIRSKVGG